MKDKQILEGIKHRIETIEEMLEILRKHDDLVNVVNRYESIVDELHNLSIWIKTNKKRKEK